VFLYYILTSLSLLFLSSYTLFASFVHMLIQCDTEPKGPQTRTNIRYSTACSITNRTKISAIFQWLFGNFRAISIFLCISLLIWEHLIVFCGTLSRSFRWRHKVLCMVGTEFVNILLMKLVFQMLIDSSTG